MVSSGLKYYFVFHQITENSSYIRIIKRVYQLMNQLKNLEIEVSYEKCYIYINSMHLGIATNIVRIYSTFN